MSLSWQLRYSVLALIWGSSFLFIKIGVESLAPLQVALVRVTIGAATLLIILLLLRQAIPRGRRTWGHIMVVGLTFNAIPFSLLSYAAERIPSALSGVLNGTTPLFTLVIAMSVLPSEKPDRWRTSGLLLGFAGIFLLATGGDLGALTGDLDGDFMAGLAMVLGASACYGVATTYTRTRLTDMPYSSLSLAFGQVFSGAVMLSLVAPFFTDLPDDLSLKAALALLALGALGTGISYLLYYGLIRDIGPTLASTVTNLFPVVAVILGVLFLGEQLTWYQVTGGAITLVGAAVAQRSKPTRPAPQNSEPPVDTANTVTSGADHNRTPGG